MYKIGVIGEKSKMLCFMAAGFTVYGADNADAAAEKLREAKNDGCAVIFVDPKLSEEIADKIRVFASEPVPAVIPLPERGGGYGITQMKNAVERAVGADIIFREQ